MALEKFDFEKLSEDRRKSIAKTIRPITTDELKSLGNEIFKFVDESWREVFFTFIADNPGATFHHAVTSDGVHLIYCRDKDKGMWFLPGQGKGPLQERGRRVMKEAIEGRR